MSDTFTPKDEVEFKEVKYLKINTDGPAEVHPYKYRVMLPFPLADWDVFDYWEKERTESMQENLNQGDVLFDIGAENGWLSAIYAQMVGGENMVLFEPTPEYWPNIKLTFEKNALGVPRACYTGLVSNRSLKAKTNNPEALAIGDWPIEATRGELLENMKYRYVHEHGAMTDQISIDNFVKKTGIVPRALTMDTEGAEIAILEGAKKTLKDNDVLVWASIHPELATKNGYGDTENIHELMKSLGYSEKFLATDHEDHWFFWKEANG